ncbi:ABC transporter ATP-binding protein [Thiotrichales bacterium 19S9-12]|nr:ABC transporter ATP-binding protein [Thiotrichales bacterium 19S9-11]MCF6811964.1 ABC transporter ATP-binding protein [Thiotrichales bacterium 19S9-12]
MSSDVCALELENVTKVYRAVDKGASDFMAVNDVSLSVNSGDFFALLGPNGAGKSTTIGMVSSLVNKTSGKIKIFGIDINDNPVKAKSLLGVMPQEVNLAIFENPMNILLNQAGYFGISRKEARANAEKRLKEMQLWDKRQTQVRFLSGGMKRRLMVARALVHNPKLLILDEPTAGVDVEIRQAIWEVLTHLNREEGLTIILTTHYLEEAESMCNRIALMNKGKVFANTDMKSLLRNLDKETFVFDLKEPLKDVHELDSEEALKAVLTDPLTLEITVDKKATLNDIFNLLTKYQVQVISARNKKARLEQLFIDLVRQNNRI